MNTSYLLLLSICVIFSAVFAQPIPPSGPVCGDGKVTGNEECDDGNTSPFDGCNANCGIENNWDCTKGDSVNQSVCYELHTNDSRTLLGSTFKHTFLTSNNGKIKNVFMVDAITAASLPIPTISTSDDSIFETLPFVSATTGDIEWKLKDHLTKEAEVITLSVSIQVSGGVAKRVVESNSSGEFVTWSIPLQYCPLEVKGSDPNLPFIQPNKKFTCYKSQATQALFYLKRVPLRPLTEYQPGDAFANGVLDCNCNFIQITQ